MPTCSPHLVRPRRTATFLVTCLLGGVGAAGTASTPATAAVVSGPVAAKAPIASPRNVTLDGVKVRLEPGTRQVVTVNRTRGTHARVTYWGHRDGKWRKKARTDKGRIGYGGLVSGTERRQGTGTTPLGTYPLESTFGSKARKSTWAMPYHRYSDDYWVLDNASPHYNRLRDRDAGGFRWWLPASNRNASERLVDYGKQYEMAVVIGFNTRNPVRYRGAGIFLHVNGTGATAGCVGVPRWFMRTTMHRLRPGHRPVIAISR